MQNFLRSVANYFNLNNRAEAGYSEAHYRQHGEYVGAGHFYPRKSYMKPWEQVVLYLATAVGVFFSSAVLAFQAGKPLTINLTPLTVLVSLVIAAIIMPYAYQKLGAPPDVPLVVRIGLFVEHGAFWPVLLTVIGKAI